VTEPSWRPHFRTPKATVTTVLRSAAFTASRERAAVVIEDREALRALGDQVETVELDEAPLSTVADRVSAAVRFLRARADALDTTDSSTTDPRRSHRPGRPDLATPPLAGAAARERLVVAALHYLVTKDDLVPDFRVGGYLDDVIVLSWVFGAAADELRPFLDGHERGA
jgi:Protein of unknown function (DUF1232)